VSNPTPRKVFWRSEGRRAYAKTGFEKLNGDPVKVVTHQKVTVLTVCGKAPSRHLSTSLQKQSTAVPNWNDADGPQMSDRWIDARLDRKLGADGGPNQQSGIRKWLLQVDETGNVTQTVIK